MRTRVARWCGFALVGAILLLTLHASITGGGLLGEPAVVVTLILAEVFALLIAFRLHPIADVTLAVFASVVIGQGFDRFHARFPGFLVACLVFAFANYLVKLVIDHSYERKLAARLYSLTAAKRVV